MRKRSLAQALLFAILAATFGGAAFAEDVTIPREKLEQLLKRLEDAEGRLQEAADKLETAGKRIDALEVKLQAPKRIPDDAIQPLVGSAPSPGGANDSGSAIYQLSADDDNPLAARVEALEKQNSEFGDALKNIVEPGTSRATVILNGRIHADYWAFPGEDDGIRAFEGFQPDVGPYVNRSPEDNFTFRRMRFGVKGKIQDNMEYKIEMEFRDPNDTEYRDVYIGFNDLPVLQTVLIGNQKRPYGLDHLNSSRYNVFIERPFVIESFNQDARRLGVASYGVSEDQAWNWRYGVYNMELTQNDAGYVDDNYQLEGAARIANTWWWDETSDGRGYGHWAVAGTYAGPDGGGGGTNETRFRHRAEARHRNRWLNTGPIAEMDTYQLLGLEGVLNVGALQLVGEVQQVWGQRDRGFDDVYFWGGYGYVSYFLTGEHVPWSRKSGTLGRVKPFENFFLVDRCCGGSGGGWGAWQVALRYSYADLTDEDITGGIGESLTFGLNWHWNPNSRMQFNYIHGTITDRGPVNGQTRGNYDIIGTRFMVDF